jgi:hypothetical protein
MFADYCASWNKPPSIECQKASTSRWRASTRACPELSSSRGVADSLGAALHDWDDRLQKYRRGSLEVSRVMSDLEKKLNALMRADRQVQNRRGDRQDLLDLGATEETGSASKIERRARKVARCPVGDVGPDQHCEMCGSFENCPRVLPQKVTL